ncbi:MAG: PEGA domain-containing protein [bacterium]|nr:PEGA domain-containing protein [bacterium]
MKILSLISIIIFSLAFIRCSDDSPVDPPSTTSKGNLVVKSIPSGARIYLMGTDTGKNTPDTLNLEAGIYDLFLFLQYYDTAFFSAKVVENISSTKEITLVDGLPFVDITLDYIIRSNGDSVQFNWVINQDVLIDSIIVKRPIDLSVNYVTDRYLYNNQLFPFEDQTGNPIIYYLPPTDSGNNFYPRIETFPYWIDFYGKKAHGSMTAFHLSFSQGI